MIPRFALVALFCLWAFFISAAFRGQSSLASSLEVGVLVNDTLEIDSSLLRRQLEAEFIGLAIKPPSIFPASIASAADIPAHLRAPVLWGERRWLNVSLPDSQVLKRPQLADSAYVLLEDVSLIGLSWEPADATIRFLANLIAGREALRNGKLEAAEHFFLAAAAVEAFWTSNAHRAYPLFLLGNLYAHRAHSENAETGYTECATKAYATATAFLGTNDNPELLAAILQNKAVTLILSGQGPLDERSIQARALMREARRAVFAEDPWKRPVSERVLNAVLENEQYIRALRTRRGRSNYE
jgi:hypothetical protein